MVVVVIVFQAVVVESRLLVAESQVSDPFFEWSDSEAVLELQGVISLSLVHIGSGPSVY